MDGDGARLARTRQEQKRLLAEHEDRGLTEKMRRHDRRVRLERARALDDGGNLGAGVGHAHAAPAS